MAVERQKDVTKFWDVAAGKLVGQTTSVQYYSSILAVCPDGKSFVVGQFENSTRQHTVRFGRIGEKSGTSAWGWRRNIRQFSALTMVKVARERTIACVKPIPTAGVRFK